jgi:hypothetical protein
MANPNIVGVSTITLENNFVDISSETTTTILSAVSTGNVVRLKEVRVSENSALPTGAVSSTNPDDDNPLYVTLNYDNGTAYPIVSKHHIPLCSTAVIFSGVFHVKEGHSLTITTGDDDNIPATLDATVAVTYEVLS